VFISGKVNLPISVAPLALQEGSNSEFEAACKAVKGQR
jgi:hypothetical protein